MSDKAHSYRITVTPLDGTSVWGRVEFTHRNHDDIARVVAAAQAGAGLPLEAAAAMALGVKLLSETVLQHRGDPLLAEIRGPLASFHPRPQVPGGGRRWRPSIRRIEALHFPSRTVTPKLPPHSKGTS